MEKKEYTISQISSDRGDNTEESWGDTLNKEIQEFWRLIFEDIQNY